MEDSTKDQLCNTNDCPGKTLPDLFLQTFLRVNCTWFGLSVQKLPTQDVFPPIHVHVGKFFLMALLLLLLHFRRLHCHLHISLGIRASCVGSRQGLHEEERVCQLHGGIRDLPGRRSSFGDAQEGTGCQRHQSFRPTQGLCP